MDYANALREGIVEAYVGIVQGLKTGDKSKFMLSLFSPPLPLKLTNVLIFALN